MPFLATFKTTVHEATSSGGWTISLQEKVPCMPLISISSDTKDVILRPGMYVVHCTASGVNTDTYSSLLIDIGSCMAYTTSWLDHGYPMKERAVIHHVHTVVVTTAPSTPLRVRCLNLKVGVGGHSELVVASQSPWVADFLLLRKENEQLRQELSILNEERRRDAQETRAAVTAQQSRVLEHEGLVASLQREVAELRMAHKNEIATLREHMARFLARKSVPPTSPRQREESGVRAVVLSRTPGSPSSPSTSTPATTHRLSQKMK